MVSGVARVASMDIVVFPRQDPRAGRVSSRANTPALVGPKDSRSTRWPVAGSASVSRPSARAISSKAGPEPSAAPLALARQCAQRAAQEAGLALHARRSRRRWRRRSRPRCRRAGPRSAARAWPRRPRRARARRCPTGAPSRPTAGSRPAARRWRSTAARGMRVGVSDGGSVGGHGGLFGVQCVCSARLAAAGVRAARAGAAVVVRPAVAASPVAADQACARRAADHVGGVRHARAASARALARRQGRACGHSCS